ALAEHWDGSTWAIQPVSGPAGAVQTILDGLSCTSATSCTAVGTYYPRPTPGVGYLPLAEHWDGTPWAIHPTPLPPPSPLPPRPARGAAPLPGAEHGHGPRGPLQPPPPPAGSPQAQLSAVSCASATSCTAVGFYYVDAGGNSGPLAEHWNGARWAIQHVPL